MPRKSYNPYMIHTEAINRFRGVANPDNELSLSKEYVGSSDNCLSFRVGELTQRPGQTKDSFVATGKITTGASRISLFSIASGEDVFVEEFASGLLRTQDVDFPSSIPRFTFLFPSDKTCGDLWDAASDSFSQYEVSARETDKAFYDANGDARNPVSYCWNLPYGGGVGGGGIPELPPPNPIVPPEFPPDIPPPSDNDFNVPVDEDSDRGPACKVSSLTVDKSSATLYVDKTAGTVSLEIFTVTVTGRMLMGDLARLASRYGYCDIDRTTDIERDDAGRVTKQTYSIYVSPKESLKTEDGGVFNDRINMEYTLCGKKYEASLAIEIISHIESGIVFGARSIFKSDAGVYSARENRTYFSGGGGAATFYISAEKPYGEVWYIKFPESPYYWVHSPNSLTPITYYTLPAFSLTFGGDYGYPTVQLGAVGGADGYVDGNSEGKFAYAGFTGSSPTGYRLQ